jgi:hypothetical protein
MGQEQRGDADLEHQLGDAVEARRRPAPVAPLYVLSGRMHVVMNDGTQAEAAPNDVVRIEPGHDAWVIGDEACVVVDFGASPAYASPHSA